MLDVFFVLLKYRPTLHDVRSAMKINYFDADGLENDYK